MCDVLDKAENRRLQKARLKRWMKSISIRKRPR